MAENLEVERAAEEEVIREKIKGVVEGKLLYESGSEGIKEYFFPDEIADGVLRASGKDAEERVKNYFSSERSMSRIDELPGDLWQPARDFAHDLMNEIIDELKQK